jgi:hypothetical protein
MTDTINDRAAEPATAPARRLQTTMAAVRVSFTWLGVKRALSRQQKQQAAEAFGADGSYLSAGKKLLDTSHPAYRSLTRIRNRVGAYWRAMSLPYPEPGLRLIRQDQVEQFDKQMRSMRLELERAVDQLSERYQELRQAARDRLGSLFSAGDYPPDLRGLFRLEWDFPSVQPPDYLMQLSPQLFEEERLRMAARFEEAVKLAEDAFAVEFGRLLTHLSERLGGRADGKPKVFRDSAVTNLQSFFERFRLLNVRSNEQLDELVESAQQVVAGLKPHELRDSRQLRQEIQSQLAGVQSALDQLLVDRPRRRIVRTGLPSAGDVTVDGGGGGGGGAGNKGVS